MALTPGKKDANPFVLPGVSTFTKGAFQYPISQVTVVKYINHVFQPQGKLLAFVETPEDTITNCAFGGEDRRTLYITCGRYLLSCRTRIAGAAPLWSRG